MSAHNATEKGLPTNVDAERFVLGSILLDDSFYIQSAGTLEVNDFSLEKHRRIFKRMGDVYERGEKIDRITIANELMKFGELESCDGLSYLVSLDDGLPQIPNVDAYIRLVKDKAILRSIIFASQHMINRCMMAEEAPDEILAGAEETLLKLGEAQVKSGLLNPDEILQGYEGGISAFLDPSKRVKGVSTGFLKLDEYTGGMHGGDLFILAGRPSMGKTAFALNIAQHVALKNKQTVAVFSLEMSKESLLTRMLCAAARVDSQRFRTGYLSQEERRRLNQSPPGSGGGAPLHRRYGGPAPHGHARQTAALEIGAQAVGPGDCGLPAADERARAQRESQSGSQRALSRPQTAGQGTQRADDGAFPVDPRRGNPAGRPPAAVERPS